MNNKNNDSKNNNEDNNNNLENDENNTSIMTKVYEFWNNRPCNIRHSDKPVGSLEYFEEVTKRKYFVESHIPEFAEFEKYRGKRVLEIGCGIGTAMISFLQAGAIYTGIDLSDSSIEIAKKRLEVYGYNAELYVANIEDLQSLKKILDPSSRFDLVYSFGVLHHTENINKAIESCKYFLKNCGSDCGSGCKEAGTFKLMLYATNSWKTFKIKEGLDQYEAQSGVPIANTYTKEEVFDILKDFKDIKIMQTHIFPYKIEEYKNYKYVLEDYFACMEPELFKCLEKNLGFHLCITCRK
jgi:2-polyprenyl-3-methyl-5-hydroxy-6-metoxy-1,4-benzoquinol methylase